MRWKKNLPMMVLCNEIRSQFTKIFNKYAQVVEENLNLIPNDSQINMYHETMEKAAKKDINEVEDKLSKHRQEGETLEYTII